MSDIEIEVDGLPVEVDEAEYNENPEAVEEEVRQNRADLRLSDADIDEILSLAPDAQQLEEEK